MTVCYGPSTGIIIFILIVSVLVPFLAVYFVRKKWKPKSRLLSVLFSIVVFTILVFGTLLSLSLVFTPECGAEISCVSVEFYPHNNTCKFGSELINFTARCNQLKENYIRYLSQPEPDKKYCPEGTILLQY